MAYELSDRYTLEKESKYSLRYVFCTRGIGMGGVGIAQEKEDPKA